MSERLLNVKTMQCLRQEMENARSETARGRSYGRIWRDCFRVQTSKWIYGYVRGRGLVAISFRNHPCTYVVFDPSCPSSSWNREGCGKSPSIHHVRVLWVTHFHHYARLTPLPCVLLPASHKHVIWLWNKIYGVKVTFSSSVSTVVDQYHY